MIVAGLLVLVLDVRESGTMSAAARSLPRKAQSQRTTSDPREGGVRGQVTVDAVGIAGADVCATEVGATEPRACTRSREDGHYLLAELHAGLYTVSASASGFASASHDAGAALTVRARRPVDGVDIALTPASPNLEGTIVDALGGEIADAEIAISRPTPASVVRARTDADGRFAAALAPGFHQLLVRAPGYAELHTVTPVPAAPLTLTLLPAASLAGHVRTLDDEPVEGMTVRAVSQTGVVQTGRSDARGAYLLSGLPPGTYAVRAEGAGYAGELPALVGLDLAETLTKLDIDVGEVEVLRGTVRITDTGEPCSAGEVSLQTLSPPTVAGAPPRGAATHTGAIDGEGKVAISAAPPGRYAVSVACVDHVYAAGPREITLPLPAPGEARDPLRWEVTRGTDAIIRVHDAAGAAVADSAVWLAAVGAEDEATPVLLSTDAAGRAHAPGLAPGSYRVRPPDPQLAAPVDFTVERGARRVEVTLRYRGSGVLTVRTARSRGLPDATLEVSALALDARDGTAPAERFAVPLPDGRHRIGPLLPGAYRVRVRDGLHPAVEQQPVMVAARPVEIVIRMPDGSATLQGRVVGADGAPVRDAWVTAASEGEAPLLATAGIAVGRGTALSDDDGHFTLRDLRADASYRVTARHHGDADAVMDGVRPGTSLTLALGATGAIRGVVVDAAGVPAQVRMVSASALDGTSVRLARLSSERGQFAIEAAAAGRVRLLAVADEGTAEAELHLRAGESLAAVKLALDATPRPHAPATPDEPD